MFSMLRSPRWRLFWIIILWGSLLPGRAAGLARDFRQPPPTAQPWVYWFFINGNITREGITADLTAMKEAGIGGVILMEVDVGVPAGPVHFMGPEWRALFKHAVREAERLGLEMAVNVGPGWTGSGGPWVPVEQSMQHVVFAETNVTGGRRFEGRLPVPAPQPPVFGLPRELEAPRAAYYRDLVLLAVPADTPRAGNDELPEKALYFRMPFSSQPGVKPYLAGDFLAPATGLPLTQILDLSAHLQPDGRLTWDAPPGQWRLLRFGLRTTGANTRPAPPPGIGFECDKFDRAAVKAHFDHFVGGLLRELGPLPRPRRAGWTMLHLDSWEMGAQNGSAAILSEFLQRRGYDARPWLPVLAGCVLQNRGDTERFLWDWRQTAQELVVENYARYLRELGRAHGFQLSIEPYDMNPCSDLTLGGVADLPMGEFWAEGLGFNAAYSCLEAVSIAHTQGRSLIPAEAFTADKPEGFSLHPAAMKAQADWAFCLGINRLVFHRFAHQPWPQYAPGMTMGQYGAHYERTQTWWPMVEAWHAYLARCQALLQRGRPVADILYLAPEGAPLVWQPPPSALAGTAFLPDRRGYNFAGCAPELLFGARVQNGRLILPSGAEFRLLVLPEHGLMTPRLLARLRDLVRAGATIMGPPVEASPSLSPDAHPERLREWVHELWGPHPVPGQPRPVGRGQVIPTDRQRWRNAYAAATQPPAPWPAAARWIWYPDGEPHQAAPPGRCHFERAFVLPHGISVTQAWLRITADNSFTAQLNGQPLGSGDNFHLQYEFAATPALRPGTNVLQITAENAGDTPNPAGLLAALLLRLGHGEEQLIVTDEQWHAALGLPSAQNPRPARVLGPPGMAPWPKAGQQRPASALPSLYGDYAQAAAVLQRLGLPPDFEADAPLRYTHRQLPEAEVYFVANPARTAVTARCWFRVHARRPERWDPKTGAQQRLTEYHEEAGRTTLALTLGPEESCFIVWQKTWTAPQAARRADAGRPALAIEIGGPWQVRFQPGRGAPESITLEQLMDLSQHPLPGVRFFSGLATYQTTLHWQPPWPGAQATLDLGRVAVMARVRVNGRTAGVAWHQPWTVDLTPALQRGTNQIAIEVANLWLNRLIGDEQLPPDADWHRNGSLKEWPAWLRQGRPSPTGRVAFATWRHWQKDSPLPPSGLLGPVTLRVQ
ncbi:MAG: glycosyl hydrolase [Verrucomicrobiae bacterium]|nr:glycosyl hydrolase [Verrucomicrobiae bacterium]